MIQNRLGCYRIGDQTFYSKLSAIEAHTRTGHHPHWDFNEEVFGACDWTQEPVESLDDLYRQRAQQLRDNYDYIVLAYSGGADSHNVLHTFLKNDIKLDEVVSYTNYDATGNTESWMNAEIFRVAAPHIDHIKQNYPWLKYRLIDQTQLILDYFGDQHNKYRWIYENNMCISPNNTIKSNLPLLIKDYRDIIESGKRFCMLVGMDKPRIFHEHGRYSFRFLDMIDISGNVSSMAGLKPYTDEMFYWTPDLPAIVIKQSHVILKYLKQDPVSQLPYVSTEKSDLAYRTENNVKYWLSNHGVHALIYSHWNPDTFSIGKSPSPILTPRDRWFFNIESTNSVHENWQAGLQRLWELLPNYWRNDPDSISAGVKGCWSRDYYLEKL
jgi:hypothetical protein